MPFTILHHLFAGVILYGSPGTGKTLLAKAVANQTSATFLRVVGSELIQKYLGDGPKMVRELFRVAEEHAPVNFFFKSVCLFRTVMQKLSVHSMILITLEIFTSLKTSFLVNSIYR